MLDKKNTSNLKQSNQSNKSQITGLVLILLSFFLIFAYFAYYYTWNVDQSILNGKGWSMLIEQTPVKNPTGRLGALITHFLFIKSFGISSILIIVPLFVFGINLLVQKKIFRVYKILFYSSVALFFFSTFFSVFFYSANFPISGAVGNTIALWLKNIIGMFGTVLLLIGILLFYIFKFFKLNSFVAEKIIIFLNQAKNLTFVKNNSQKQTINPQTEIIQPLVAEETLSEKNPIISHQAPEILLNENDQIDKNGSPNPVMQNQVPFEFTPNFNNQQYENIEFEFFEKENEITPLNADKNNPLEFEINPTDAQKKDIESEEKNHFQPIKEELIVLKDNTIKIIDLSVTNIPMGVQEIQQEEIRPVLSNIPINSSIDLEIVSEPNKSTHVSLPSNHVNFVNILKPNRASIESESKVKEFYDPTMNLANFVTPYSYHKRDELLNNYGNESIIADTEELQKNKDQIINTLKNYDISIDKIRATVGPTVTLYEIVPSAGVRISKIRNLEDDIALSLAALGIRIIAPIPGKGTIGIEVPNLKKSIVTMKALVNSPEFRESKYSLPIALGKTIDNQNYIVDLATMPHMLMAGATGQGKSVGINTILVSLLWKKHPSQLKFVLVDPKKVELSIYKAIEKHYLAKLPDEEDAIITDTKKVVHTINALCIEMDNRYDLLKNAGARNIKEYNEKFLSNKLDVEHGHKYLPFIVLVIDEFADLIMTAGKEVEMPIARLAQLARAIGIHLIIATQRPSVNIITGIIKANFPVRIAFKVSSKIDSRTILDAGGADQLIGKGDMLISHNGDLIRLQCAFVDTPEVEKIVDFISSQDAYSTAFLLPEYIDPKELDNNSIEFETADQDVHLEDAAKLIIQKQVASTSLIQRHLKLGYNRAGRIMDQLEQLNIVGPAQGSKPRELKVKTETELDIILNNFR